MRTIKFRVWDGKYMDYDVWVNSCGAFGDSEKKYNTPNIEISSYHNKSIIMQFTGLHDKNGREIYEGDIVSYKRNVGNWTGKSLTTIHEIIFTEEINAFVMKDNSGYIKLRKHLGYEYEVIGNIYENAELLNQ